MSFRVRWLPPLVLCCVLVLLLARRGETHASRSAARRRGRARVRRPLPRRADRARNARRPKRPLPVKVIRSPLDYTSAR